MDLTHFLFIIFVMAKTIECQTKVEDSLSKATIKFALDVLKANGNADKNVFFSPASISVCVGMAYAGSAGQTNTQINKAVFNGMNDQLIYDQMKNLSGTLNSPSTSYKLNSANRLYAQNKFPILQSYLDKIKTYFQSEVKSVDFVHNAEPTRIEINTWVENVTNSKIKDLIPQGSLDSSTALVLVNAIYFKGDWSHKFNSSNTAKGTFYSSANKNSQIDMMKQVNEKFYYTEDDNVQVLGLPYVTDQLAFYVFLPKQRFGLSQLESKLTQDYFSDLLNNGYERKVAEIQIPKFKLEQQFLLNDIFQKLGIKDMFSPNADFSLIDGNKDLFASAVIHKAFIEVNEEGSEAAAATAIVIERMSAIAEVNPPPRFIADHPYLFAIVDRRISNPLFFGRFVGN